MRPILLRLLRRSLSVCGLLLSVLGGVLGLLRVLGLRGILRGRLLGVRWLSGLPGGCRR